MTAPWRNCAASLVLVAEINQRWPNRDRGSDGTIGDAAHALRTSDHNPWLLVDDDRDGKPETGVVRARDVDKDGIDAAWLAEYLRGLGARRDGRLWPAGYVIFNRRITTPDFTGWRAYTGTNPHTAHVHVSFTTTPGTAGFDSIAPWGIATTAAKEDDDMFTDQDRALLQQVRTDVGFARDQTLSQLGVIDTVHSPIKRTPEQAGYVQPARKVDLDWQVGQLMQALATQTKAVDELRGQVAQLVQVLTPKPINVIPPKG